MTRYRVKVSGWAIVEADDRLHAQQVMLEHLNSTDNAETVESSEFFLEAREAHSVSQSPGRPTVRG